MQGGDLGKPLFFFLISLQSGGLGEHFSYMSRRPLEGVESAPDYPLFSNPVMARAVYGVEGEPDYGDNVQNIAEEGQVC